MIINYKSISDLNNSIIENIHKIPYDIDLIVGIPRSGIIPANLIALYRNIPYVNLNEFEAGIIFSGGERLNFFNVERIKKVLIMDDSLWSGKALTSCKERISKLPYDFQYIYAVIYIIPQSIELVDIYLEELSLPRVFQWNIMHHNILSRSCVDIDGVLCLDPTEEENDDGEKYEFFLKNAKPLFIPTVTINTLVSCRLEKYRKLTEEWLSRYNIKYNNLILLDLPDKITRIKWNKYGEYKADVYNNSGCDLFIESSFKQALRISQITSKPVFCIETFDMMPSIFLKPKVQTRIIDKVKRTIKKFIKTR